MPVTGGSRPRVVVAFGTRPEANKMAPVVAALERAGQFEVLTLVTGQHREQLDGSLATFGLRADADLNVMTERQTLPQLVGRITPAAAEALKALRADYVLVHGDTTTTFAVAFAAFLEDAGAEATAETYANLLRASTLAGMAMSGIVVPGTIAGGSCNQRSSACLSFGIMPAM